MKKKYNFKMRLALALTCLTMGLSSLAQVQVVATAGVTGPTVYPDLGSAFAAINAGTHQGIIGVGIVANTTETAPCVLNSSGAGSALYTAVTISPITDGVSVSCNTTAGRGVIELKGADNVTIDGDNPNTAGINRNLSIINTSTSTISYTSCIRIANTVTVVASSDNNIIRNCILTGSASGRNASGNTSTTGSENTTFGIVAGNNGGTTAIDSPTPITSVTGAVPAGTTVNALLISNNAINSCARGIAFNGNGAANSTGVTISNNLIGDQVTTLTTTGYPFIAPTTTVYTKGIYIQGTTAISITGNTIKNILSYVSTPISGIELNSAIGTGTIEINNNIVNGVALNAASGSSVRGITVANAGGPFTISGNTITNIQGSCNSTTSTARPFGLFVSTSAASALIEKNKITTVYDKNTGTFGVSGVFFNGGSNITFRNNFVSDINQDISGGAAFSNTTWGIFGVTFNSGTGHIVYNNSINLSGSMQGTTSVTSVLTAAFVINGTGQTGMNVRNNIFSNTLTGGTTSIAHVAMFLPSGASSTMNLTLNNNAYYSGTDNARQGIAQAGTTAGTGFYIAPNFIAGATAPATNLRSYSSTLSVAATNDNASYASTNAAPFVSATDLHINTASPELPNIEGKGDAAVAVTTDIDADPRPNPPTTVPDMGADEVVAPGCVSSNGGTITPATYTKCVGQTVTLSSTGASTGLGISYQWMIASVSGGPYTNVTGGTGATTLSYTTAALTAGTSYYVLQTTCSSGPSTGLSNEVTVTVNTLPTVTASPATSSICQPGATAVALTAGGATTYAWLPATGLSATTGTPVNALPGASVTYTVTGTDGNGCTATATAAVNVSETPSGVIATATPASVCSGGNSQLNAAGAITTSYTLSSITPNIIPLAGATTISTWANADGDDGSNGPVVLPFGFNYYGNTYSQIYIGSNGYISFNSLAAESGASLRTAQTFPSTATPNNVIALSMADLNQATPGVTSVFTTGVAPNRIFVVDFNAIPFYGTPNIGSVSGQIQLFESTNVVEIHVAGVAHSTSTSNNSLGIENAAGTVGSTPAGRGASVWNVATPEAYRWTPSGAGTMTYAWSPATFLSSTTIANPMATAITSSTTYTVTASNNGCTATASVAITAGAALTATSNITPASTVCEGTTITLNSVPTGGGLPYTYSWSGPAGYTSTLQNPSFVGTPAASGTYTITVTDNCAATSISTVTLTVNPTPTISVTPTSALYCNPGTGITLAASGTSTSYAWLPATGLSAASGASVTATPASTTTYTVTGTDGNGCIASTTTIISSAPAVIAAAATATPAAICLGSSTTLNATANPVAPTLLTENFNGAATGWTTINNSTGGTPAAAAWTLRPNSYAPGGYWASVAGVTAINSNDASQFYLTNSDSQGSGSNTSTILQSPMMNTSGYATLNLDFYNFFRFNATPDSANVEVSTNGTTWTRVNSANGSTTGAATTFAHTTVNLDSYVGNSTFFVRFRFTSAWGYGWAIDNVSLTGTSTAYTYNWSSTPAGFTSTSQSPTASPTVSTNYGVTISNAFGCSATANTNVTVNPVPAAPTAAGTAICTGTTATLTTTGTGTIGWYDAASAGTHVGSGASFTTPSLTSTTTYYVQDSSASGCTSTRTAVAVTVNPLPPVMAMSTASAVCAGGSVTLSGMGATSYTWTAPATDGVAFTPAATATYTVTGTDGNGCMNTATTTVTVNPLPVVALGADITQCGGSVMLDAGNAGANYMWNDASTAQTLTASATGTYSVTVTDAVTGCAGTDAINVTINANPTVMLGADITQCGGSVMLDAGNAGANYMWNDASTAQTLTASTSGTYSVTVTDAVTGCLGTDAINVTINANPTVMLGTDTTQCGGSVMLDAGNAGANYMWNDASTAQTLTAGTSGTYSVTVTDAVTGCSGTDAINVTINTIPTVSMTAFGTSVCDNSPAFALTNGSPAGGMYSGTAVSSGMFDPTAAGAGMFLITYTITDVNTCSASDTASVTVDLCSGIASTVSNASGIVVYPNPASGMVNIAISNANFSQLVISIVDVQGKEVYNEIDKNISTEYNKQINIENLAKGVYFIKMNTGSDSKIQKLIIQ